MKTKARTPLAKSRKMMLQALIGGLVGAAVSFAALTVLDDRGLDVKDSARVLALLTGAVLALIGGLIAFGVAAPRQGAMLLNVQDADELREERNPLTQGAMILLLLAAGLIALTLAKVGDAPGLLPQQVALTIALTSFAAIALLAWRSRNTPDEFMQKLSAEAASVALYAVLSVAAVWAALAHLGYVSWVTPLGALAGLVCLQLLATFYVVGRRGMLAPR